MENNATFEDALKELEVIVEKLESGSLKLDEMIKLFEKGVNLTKSCQTHLKDAQDKVQTITKNGDDYIKKSGVHSS